MSRGKTILFSLPILGFAVFFLTALMFLHNDRSTLPPEPLADPISLSTLISGQSLSIPPEEHHAEFHGAIVTPPGLAQLKATSRVLGVTSANDKRIEVDLTHQHVYAYEGNRQVFNFIISSGKWYPTPTGTFHIWAKVKSQLMSGGNKDDGTYYYLPNVPWVMFFYNDDIVKSRGFSFHGTYWHNNFGHPMSHGCVNMRSSDAALLFAWADPTITNPAAWSTNATTDNPGTEVIIYGTTPTE